MARPNHTQSQIVERLIAGHAFPFSNAADRWIVQTHQVSVEKGTRQVMFQRAVRRAEADPQERTSYRYELFRIDPAGEVRKL
jgi:hypothetical protein